jgi:anti-sigma B factor antagonist/stage II sporulation protein AA (anti-sigma F factor antagonist)
VGFSSRQIADVVVATPVGRIDHAAAPVLEQALLPLLIPSTGSSVGLIVDLAEVEYISSVGLRVLMVAAKQARASGVRIAVAALQPIVAEIFAISRFDAVLDVYPSVRSALEGISSVALAEFDTTRRSASA